MIFYIEKKQPNRIAVWEDDGSFLTYQQLCKEVLAFGKNIKHRSLIFCLCRNTTGALIGYLGGVNDGHVVMMLDAEIENAMLQQLLNVYQPQYIWAPAEKEEQIIALFEYLEYKSYGYGLFRTRFEREQMEESLSLLLTTSGSMGNPKMVRISRQNMETNAQVISEYLELSTEERPITTLPMQYTYGLSVINSHLLVGGCILMTRKSIVQKEFWDYFQERKATSFAGVSYTYEMLKKLRVLEKDLPGLTSMTQAGGKLPEYLQKEFALWARKHGIRFYVMYGQTEATARMSYLPYAQCLEKIGSIGIPIRGGKFILRDENGNIIHEAESAGELIYQGPNVSLGYANCKEDLKKTDERNGVLETGDIAKRDQDGFYYIVGRKKRFIKIYGVRIGLDECEQLLRNQYKGTEFACVGEDDHLLIYTDNSALTGVACKWIAGILHLNPKAFTSHYRKAIPKSDSGKIQYSFL